MSGQPFPGVPVNPRLEFGVPLEEVCDKGVLHPGLRELFLKAYLSAGGYDRGEEEQFNGLSKIPYVLEALKAGPKGQGSLADRMSLKLKVESGKWIIATQVPAGSPLWLVRHFLGRLPRPLLDGLDWRTIAVACRVVPIGPKSHHQKDEVLEKISTALAALPTANCLILAALVLLIRNLSMVMSTHDSASVTLHEEALEALSQYFTAAIISRPYRPGLYTMLDRDHEPLLLFLSEHWLEVKELCQHTGISRYRSTCESRYEFVSPDTEVDHTRRHALATAEDIDEEIDAPESLTRKANKELRHITNPHTSIIHCAVKDPRISKKEIEPIDVAVAPNIQKNEIPGNGIPVTVQMPKGVYLIPPKMECIHTSLVDEEATGKVMENFSHAIALVDTELNQDCTRLDDPEIDHLGYLFLRKVVKDKSNNNLKFDVKNLISKYEGKAVLFTGVTQALRYDDLPSKRKVMVKINGTQTFACEFSEDGQPTEVEKLQERTNELRGFPRRMEIPQNSGAQERPEENIGPSSGFEFSKIYGKRTSMPLTKSTASLIKNFTSDEETVYLPTRSDSINQSTGKVISQVEQATRPKEDALTLKTYKDGKALMNPVKDLDKSRYQKANSNCNDFVTELKNNFKQGRKRPSLAKLSLSQTVLADDSGQTFVTTTDQGTSKFLHIGEFFCEENSNILGSAESSCTQELFPRRCSGAAPPANSA